MIESKPMPKAILKFKLPEEENEFKVAQQGRDLLSFVCEFNQQLRSWTKHGHSFETANDALHGVRDEFYRILQEYPQVDIDL